jgi:hypothetical protein
VNADPAIADDQRPPRRWIHTLLAIVVVGMLLDILVGVGLHLFTGRMPLLPVLAIFLILSGIRLVGVAIDTIQRIQGGPVVRGWGWVVYKLVAAAVAFGGAGYLLLAEDAHKLEQIFSGG